MTVLYYYLFINKGILILKSIRENILYSKSVREFLLNVVNCFILFIAVPLSCYWFLIYLNNWTAMSLVSPGVIENKVVLFLLKCFFTISFIDILGLIFISLLGIIILAFMLLKRFFFELFSR